MSLDNKIFQGNQVIALFMGWTSEEIRIYMTLKGTENGKLAYHKSWDLLMPVIEKVESLKTDKENGEEYQFSITGDGISITKYDDGSGIISSRHNPHGESKLHNTFEVVVNFCCEYLKINTIF